VTAPALAARAAGRDSPAARGGMRPAAWIRSTPVTAMTAPRCPRLAAAAPEAVVVEVVRADAPDPAAGVKRRLDAHPS
jgi:hypothetical protein